MAWTAPTTAAFKAYFDRDFNFAPADAQSNQDFVLDTDIARAIAEATVDFNPELADDDNVIFMYLIAFHMVENLRNSAKGITAQARFPINSKSAGGVSVSYQIPQRFADDPQISRYSANGYGMKYLSLVLPQLVGNIGIIEGTTTVG